VTRVPLPFIARLEAAFRSGLPVVTCEIAAGDGADPDDVARRVRLVRDHVDAVNVPDNTAGVVHMAAWAASIVMAREGVDPIMHVTCRDRNRLALQSDLLGASALRPERARLVPLSTKSNLAILGHRVRLSRAKFCAPAGGLRSKCAKPYTVGLS